MSVIVTVAFPAEGTALATERAMALESTFTVSAFASAAGSMFERRKAPGTATVPGLAEAEAAATGIAGTLLGELDGEGAAPVEGLSGAVDEAGVDEGSAAVVADSDAEAEELASGVRAALLVREGVREGVGVRVTLRDGESDREVDGVRVVLAVGEGADERVGVAEAAPGVAAEMTADTALPGAAQLFAKSRLSVKEKLAPSAPALVSATTAWICA